MSTDADISVVRERHGPFTRYVMSAATQVPGESFEMNAEVSVYQVGDVLIDSGPARFAPALVEALVATPPGRILLTHQHEDHAGGVPMLRQAFDISQVFAPRSLLPFLADPAAVDTYRLKYWGPIAPLADVAAVDEGDMFTVLDVSIEAVATPGHTPGHIAYLARSGGRLRPDWRPAGQHAFVSRVLRVLRRGSDCLTAEDRGNRALYLLPAHGRARPDGALTLSRAADFLETESATIRAAASRLQTTDPIAVALDLYGAPEPAELATGGDYSTAALVRSVLAPVRRHPVPRLHLRTAPRT